MENEFELSICGISEVRLAEMAGTQQSLRYDRVNLSAFYETRAAIVEEIMFAHPVPFLAQNYCADGDRWEDVEARASSLRTLPFDVATCREWRDMLSTQTTVELSSKELSTVELDKLVRKVGVWRLRCPRARIGRR